MSRTFVLSTVLAFVSITASAAEPASPVTLTEDDGGFTLANGIVTARVTKRTGVLALLKFQGLELLGAGSGAPFGYWSHVGGGSLSSRRETSVRIHPATNDGERAIVAVKFLYDGAGSLPVDVDLRYALGRGDSGVYASAIWEHKSGYPGFSVGEARFAAKLNPDVFDFLAVDARRRRVMPTPADWDQGSPLNMKEARRMTTGRYAGQPEHKYDYSAVLFDTPAYGWSSTRHRVGLWIVNPSIEYLSGGATKVELTGHLDVNSGGAPVLLNMWKGSHYGGSTLAVAAGESWTKCVGPFLLYCNAASGHDELWKDALARAAKEAADWPYAWAADASYPDAPRRGTVTGKIVLRDPTAPGATMSNLLVGLAAPDYVARAGRRGATTVDWQMDAKFYQFWARADADGRFVILQIRPGAYTLHAIADGVLGEFSLTNVNIAAGASNHLGTLEWTPLRHGRTLWEIGIPDRTAREFRHGDHYWQWGLYHEYPKEFPNDVNFVIGRSDWRRDWNYCQPPRLEGRQVTPTTWSVTFELPQAPRGQATLRLAIAGSRVPGGIEVKVNEAPVGGTGPLPDTGVMHRDGIRGYWCERAVPFDAARLRAGTNLLQLHVPANNWVQGVLYDYLRLELDESFPAAPLR